MILKNKEKEKAKEIATITTSIGLISICVVTLEILSSAKNIKFNNVNTDNKISYETIEKSAIDIDNIYIVICNDKYSFFCKREYDESQKKYKYLDIKTNNLVYTESTKDQTAIEVVISKLWDSIAALDAYQGKNDWKVFKLSEIEKVAYYISEDELNEVLAAAEAVKIKKQIKE